MFTPPDATLKQILGRLPLLPGAALLRLRLPELADRQYEALARELVPRAREVGIQLVLDRQFAAAADCGAAGWHARASKLQSIDSSSHASLWKLASCHDADELLRARELGYDAAVLGPVLATATHTDRSPLGWNAFESLAQGSGLPVYAIGGVGPAQREDAFRHYAQGTAAIRAYWR